MTNEAAAISPEDATLRMLARDLEPYRGKTIGSLRIDMGEVQKILALLDERHRLNTRSPVLSDEQRVLVRKLRARDPFVNDPISLQRRLRNPDGPEAADLIEALSRSENL